ncbi:MAG: hypothetical protein QNK68_00325, partial [Flavobacteriales bacterium]
MSSNSTIKNNSVPELFLQKFKTLLFLTVLAFSSFSVFAQDEPSDDLVITATVCSEATEVAMTGPWWGWDPAGGPIGVSDGQGSWTFTFSPAPTENMEFLIVVDGVQEVLYDNAGNGECGPSVDDGTLITDYWSYANRVWVLGSEDPQVFYESCTDCSAFEEPTVLGCMDATACNYNMEATEDDASCSFAAEGFDCDGNCLSGTAVVYTAGSYPDENSFTISDCDGNVLASMASGVDGFNSCVELGENYSISLVDSYGDGWNGGSLSIGGVAYTVDDDAVNNDDYSEVIGSCGVAGCMDASACNYNMDATFDDASCTFAIEGLDCDGACLDGGAVLTMTDSYGDGWNGNILTINGVDYAQGSYSWPYTAGASESACVEPADCYVMSWTEGAYSIETSWTFEGTSGSGGSAPSNIGDCVTGCTDETATNYNADSDLSDNTLCEYALVQGCMDATACNYDAAAEQDNGSCTYAAEGFDCEGNCLDGTLTSINVQEISTLGYTYTLTGY